MDGKLQQWIYILICFHIVLRIESVDITYITSAVAKGAVCLDGSPPAYYLDQGSGDGINNWLMHMEGGGWCNNVTSCLARKNTQLGSSKEMAKQLGFIGLLSNDTTSNPDFYKWNRVFIRYCDGASFTGDIEKVDNATKLYYRGARIFLAVIEDLLAKGMKNAKNAILSGCSAGGLASIIHCDNFKSLLPTDAKVKCLSDAGFFINIKDINGSPRIQDFYNDLATTHGSAKNLPISCTSQMNPSQCFFPQNVAKRIQTPLFIVNSAYDVVQIRGLFIPYAGDPLGLWNNCKDDIKNCSTSQLQTIQRFRSHFLNAFGELGASKSRGYFINSCYIHCQTEMQQTWFRNDSHKLNGKTIAKAVADWFYDESPFQDIDCPYPCDKTCHNLVYDSKSHVISIG